MFEPYHFDFHTINVILYYLVKKKVKQWYIYGIHVQHNFFLISNCITTCVSSTIQISILNKFYVHVKFIIFVTFDLKMIVCQNFNSHIFMINALKKNACDTKSIKPFIWFHKHDLIMCNHIVQ